MLRFQYEIFESPSSTYSSVLLSPDMSKSQGTVLVLGMAGPLVAPWETDATFLLSLLVIPPKDLLGGEKDRKL